MEIAYLPEPEAHPLWSAIKALLQPAADIGGIEVYGPGVLVWIAIEGDTVFAAMTTGLSGTTAEILCAGGTRLNDWLPQWMIVAEEWARNCGAKWIECRGRKGWGRFAERYGWRTAGHDNNGLPVFEKELI